MKLYSTLLITLSILVIAFGADLASLLGQCGLDALETKFPYLVLSLVLAVCAARVQGGNQPCHG